MSIADVPGLAEKVDAAVRPLTEKGDFYLTNISHEDYYGDVDVVLTSKEFNIIFHILLKAPQVFTCSFKVNSFNKYFSAEFLFPAFLIDIPLRNEQPGTASNFRRIKDIFKDRKKINSDLLERSKFIPEIQRLSSEIINILPLLDELFLSSNIDKTWDLYLAEARKRNLKQYSSNFTHGMSASTYAETIVRNPQRGLSGRHDEVRVRSERNQH